MSKTIEVPIEVSEETYEKIKDQLNSPSDCSFDYDNIQTPKDMIGGKFYFRTITYDVTGRVIGYMEIPGGVFLNLENAAWIGEGKRFSSLIGNAEVTEVEPVGREYINLQTVTDFFPWKHVLPENLI